MENVEATLRGVIRDGEMCPYCRSENIADRSESDLGAEKFDWLCSDCGLLWKKDGIGVQPPTKKAPKTP